MCILVIIVIYHVASLVITVFTDFYIAYNIFEGKNFTFNFYLRYSDDIGVRVKSYVSTAVL